jgi:hypothetical protein
MAKRLKQAWEETEMRVVNRKTQGNRRIKRASGFHRAWLIADQLNRLQDGAGAVLTQALVTQWLSEQRRWA